MPIYGRKKSECFHYLINRLYINMQCGKQNRKKKKKKKLNKQTKDMHTSITECLHQSKRQNVAIVYLLLINPLFVFRQNMCVKWNPPSHTHTHTSTSSVKNKTKTKKTTTTTPPQKKQKTKKRKRWGRGGGGVWRL